MITGILYFSARLKALTVKSKVGLFRPITIWPFPEEAVLKLSKDVKSILVAEMNLGQIFLEVERIVGGNCDINHIGKANGEVITPEEIIGKLKEVL